MRLTMIAIALLRKKRQRTMEDDVTVMKVTCGLTHLPLSAEDLVNDWSEATLLPFGSPPPYIGPINMRTIAPFALAHFHPLSIRVASSLIFIIPI